LLRLLLHSDRRAEFVQGGSYGLYVRVHHGTAEAAARLYAVDEGWLIAWDLLVLRHRRDGQPLEGA
jgi:hypothetical protein